MRFMEPAQDGSRALARRERVARLVQVSEAGDELRRGHHLLFKDVVVIGRSRACAVQVTDDAEVSRRHCELRRVGERWYLVDVGSTHGVTVNGQRVVEHVLSSGDTVRIGNTTLRFRLG